MSRHYVSHAQKLRARKIQLPSGTEIWEYLGIRCRRLYLDREIFGVVAGEEHYFGNAWQTRLVLARLFTQAEKDTMTVPPKSLEP